MNRKHDRRQISSKIAAITLTVGVSAFGIVTQAADGPGVALTVYNQNLGLVKDTRSVDLKSGSTTIRFDDVSAQIDPTSVHVKALQHPGEVTVLEQNYQYDLADADRLMQRYLNRSVTAVMKDGASVSGTLLSFDGGSLVLKDGDGVRIVTRSEVKNVSLGELPGGLVVRPTLVWDLDSQRSGSELIEVSYLTTGINWHAEYVAVVDAEDKNLDLTGWVSIDNQSGATYENARLRLVAGDINRVQPEMPPMPRREMLMSADGSAEKQFAEEAFFEYHLYTLARPATVRDRETKQLALFPQARTGVIKKMTYDGQRDAKKVSVSVEFANSETNGLGMALPKGTVRVYKQARDGAEEFIGEDRMDHTAKDEKVRLTLGNAFDVVGERTQTDYQRIDDRNFKQSVKIEIRNHKTEAVDVSIIEHLPGTWTVTEKSHDFKKTDAQTIEFPVSVPADGTVTVLYTARIKY
ncbi:MAG: DUF4139 domain-containing protein [Candidatus Eisenbacteria bacterium]|nr:DUF4139 domain-containing protein [Candidatus Eisenbacteria bacterium]